jgi:Uma2 family endonuclease
MTSSTSLDQPQALSDRELLHNVTWEHYEQLLQQYENHSAPRLTYDRGTLEIMSPLPKHEVINHTIETIVEALAVEWDMEFVNFGSATFKSEELLRGFEPNTCFYFRRSEEMRSKERIDLRIDPAPELVIEIDITHSTLDKLSIYASLGVAEVWRYADDAITILILESNQYGSSEMSRVLPGLAAMAISEMIATSRTLGGPAWHRHLRAWAAQQQRPGY